MTAKIPNPGKDIEYRIYIDPENPDIVALPLETMNKVLDLMATGWAEFFKVRMIAGDRMDVADIRMDYYIKHGFKQWMIDKVEAMLL